MHISCINILHYVCVFLRLCCTVMMRCTIYSSYRETSVLHCIVLIIGFSSKTAVLRLYNSIASIRNIKKTSTTSYTIQNLRCSGDAYCHVLQLHTLYRVSDDHEMYIVMCYTNIHYTESHMIMRCILSCVTPTYTIQSLTWSWDAYCHVLHQHTLYRVSDDHEMYIVMCYTNIHYTESQMIMRCILSCVTTAYTIQSLRWSGDVYCHVLQLHTLTRVSDDQEMYILSCVTPVYTIPGLRWLGDSYCYVLHLLTLNRVLDNQEMCVASSLFSMQLVPSLINTCNLLSALMFDIWLWLQYIIVQRQVGKRQAVVSVVQFMEITICPLLKLINHLLVIVSYCLLLTTITLHLYILLLFGMNDQW